MNLPTVRIQKVVLDNFKSVKHGEITLNCGREFVPYGTRSDILGLYGQNGSGKTTLIEALYILKGILIGGGIPKVYSECISKNADYAHMEFTFDLQYPDGMIRKVVYGCSLKSVKAEKDPDEEMDATDHAPKDRNRLCIFDEKLSMSEEGNGVKNRMQTFMDTSAGTPFSPVSKVKEFIGDDKSMAVELEVNKRMASEKSTSFLFYRPTLELFKKTGLYSKYFQVLLELNFFGENFLFVVDTKSSGYIRLNFALPLYTSYGRFVLATEAPFKIENKAFEMLQASFEDINLVISQLVPGLSVKMKVLSPALLKDGIEGQLVEIVSEHDGIELPLRDESDGVRKIISVLMLIIRAYNDQSTTIAIDEFDAGIYEYLLGEILQIFEESGKGQFIFTSHNLRPLEVISNKFLYFTTTNPENRYIRLKNVRPTNNLRDIYFREIMLGDQTESIYKETKKYRIIEALKHVEANEKKRFSERMSESDADNSESDSKD